MANKQMQSCLRRRIENRQKSTFTTKPLKFFFCGVGVIVLAVLVYSAYNEWFRPLGLGH